jgi:uncharacterized protein (DUF2235 family)
VAAAALEDPHHLGLATGAGISDNVMQAYEFLVENWEYGDRIYVLGFSRGAYTARLLAGFIRIFGLVRREQLQLLRFAWRAYTRLGQPGSKDFSAEIGHFQKVLGGNGVRIEFLGLWDTVASVFDSRSGFPWLTITQKAYTNQNDRVKIVRHAVAIDEQRTYFQPSLWEPGRITRNGRRKKAPCQKRPQDFEEVWFTGCHGDVGGGYPDAKKSGLAKIPLEWLYREAEAAGIAGMRRCSSLLAHGKGSVDSAGKAGIWPGTKRIKRTKDYGGPRSARRHQPVHAGRLADRRIPAPQGPGDLVPHPLQARQILHSAVRLPPCSGGRETARSGDRTAEKRKDYRPPNLPETYEVVKTRPKPGS